MAGSSGVGRLFMGKVDGEYCYCIERSGNNAGGYPGKVLLGQGEDDFSLPGSNEEREERQGERREQFLLIKCLDSFKYMTQIVGIGER